MGIASCAYSKDTLNRPELKQKPVIWGDFFNTETRMILATLHISEDTDYDMIMIDSLNKKQKTDKKYKKINPTGKIPTLVEGSYTMLGSGDMLILIYLCQTHG